MKSFKFFLKIVALSFIMFLCFVGAASAQNAKQDASGNYIAISDTGSKPTGKVFTDSKGIKYPVLVSANGKLYYMRTSKAGKVYKAYIKL